MSASAPAPIGVIAHYNLLERLDAAGVGELYRARDTRAGRTVAVRVLPRGFTPDSPALVDGIRSVQVLSHPNAIAVFDAGIHEGRVYVVFEFVKGRSLRSEMGGGPIGVRRAVDLAIQMTDAIAEAHAAGFMHRGLSLESVAITGKGHAKIPAFELAVQNGLEQVGGVPRLRDSEAPEEAQGTVDERSDIYSVGAILYEMLTARPPMPRGSAAPSASNPNVRGDLDAVVLKAVAPNPNSRYQTAVTLAAALRETAAALQAAEEERVEPERAAASTSMGGVIVTAVVILLVLAVILWWVMSR